MRFHERQRFRQLWLWLLLLGVLIVNAVSVVRFPVTSTITGLVIVVAVMVMLAYAHLDVMVTDDEVVIRFRPFHIRGRRIPLRELAEVHARDYRPIAEYGGWGIRLSGNGMAYNTHGTRGVQLVLKNGTRILIGSQRSDELAAALRHRRHSQMPER